MKESVFYCAGSAPALERATAHLQASGVPFADCPRSDVTHLLLPVPTFAPDQTLRGGGAVEELLRVLPKNITVIGGNLSHPALDSYSRMDLLQDPEYLAENAQITARCALTLIASSLPCTLKDCPVLVIGWGRIGKVLSMLLRRNDARVTVVARKETDRAMLQALGYEVQSTPDPKGFRVIVNTAPACVLEQAPAEAVKMELSSLNGIPGEDVIQAKGLPGKYAPESSGELIARTVLRLLGKEKKR